MFRRNILASSSELKGWYISTSSHCIKTWETIIDTFAAMRISNLTGPVLRLFWCYVCTQRTDVGEVAARARRTQWLPSKTSSLKNQFTRVLSSSIKIAVMYIPFFVSKHRLTWHIHMQPTLHKLMFPFWKERFMFTVWDRPFKVGDWNRMELK
jgi:hypothetical protein